MSAPYDALSPDCVLAAVEITGHLCDGRLLALNSFENRVYQVGIEDAKPMIAKFYRPERWSDSAIIEEHDFAQEMLDAELPVIAPWRDPDGRSLFTHEGFRFALFERMGGHADDLEQPDKLEWFGRLLARMHAIGARRRFVARERLAPEVLGPPAIAAVSASGLLPMHLETRYPVAAGALLERIGEVFAEHADVQSLRLHGDCHAGNVLWNDRGPWFVDLDDARQGPAVQDIWMLLPAEPNDFAERSQHLLRGYVQFMDFDWRSLALIPALRALRQLHYAGWVAARWSDPAFPRSFAWAGEARWWEQHVRDLADLADELGTRD